MLGVIVRTLLGCLIGMGLNTLLLWLFGFNMMVAPIAFCLAFPCALIVNYRFYKKDKENESL